MPPSGFSQKAINGLLTYVESSYKRTLQEYENHNRSKTGWDTPTKQEHFLISKAMTIENYLAGDRETTSVEGIIGLNIFTAECYKDLAAEIKAGKDKYKRPVTDENAIQKELKQIRDYLTKFKI